MPPSTPARRSWRQRQSGNSDMRGGAEGAPIFKLILKNLERAIFLFPENFLEVKCVFGLQ